MMHIVNKDTCKYCMDCGGCDYVDVPYPSTLDIKLNNINGLFAGATIKPDNLEAMQIVPSPMPFGYRGRCQLHVSKGKVGFHKKRSHDLIEIEKCIMFDERLNQKIKELKFPANFEAKIELYIKDSAVCDRLVEKKYDNLFYQVNEGVNKLIINEVVALCASSPDDAVLELYCGLGNFTFAILNKSPKTKITGIDMRTPVSKKDNPEFIEADIIKGLETLRLRGRLTDFSKLLLDPPRSGAGEKVLGMLGKCKFEKIVYVSCNPETLIDDARILCAQGYKWQSIKLFDMFPFTKYVEAVSLFTRPA
jgi:tRNA/tmRNA/rRNA uracil-C5-methylase (TrmA/RlmC/RlmD family)